MCSISSDPVDALVHRVFDFYGGPPLLELGTLDEMQRPRPSIFTVHGSAPPVCLGCPADARTK